MFSPSLPMAGRHALLDGPVGSFSHASVARLAGLVDLGEHVLMSCWKSSVRATKSDSQFTSTRMPCRWSADTRWPISPSLVARPAFFAALASPLLRKNGRGLLEVAVGLLERGLAVHHPRARLVAELLHVCCADRHGTS